MKDFILLINMQANKDINGLQPQRNLEIFWLLKIYHTYWM